MRARVLEPGPVLRDLVRDRKIGPGYVCIGLLVEPDEAAGGVRVPPELAVAAPVAPSVNRAGEAEKEVGDVGGSGFLVRYVSGQALREGGPPAPGRERRVKSE